MIWGNEVWSHLLVTFVYFFIVSVLRWKVDFNLIGLWLGAGVGMFLLDIDHLFYWWYLHPEKEDSVQARGIWEKEGFRGIRGIREILEKYHHTHNRLIFHSVLGQIVLLLLAFYLLTSGGSYFGSGLILSINLHLLKDEWADFLKNKEHLKDWLFWQVRETGLPVYLKEYLVAISVIFLLLTMLLVRG